MSKLYLKKVRLGGNSIFKAKAFQEGGEPNFSAIFMLDKEDPQLKQIKSAIAKMAKEKWNGTIPKGCKFCLTPGSERDNEIYEDYMTFSASEKQRPAIVNKDPHSPVYEEDNIIYPGCFVNAVVTLWAQDNRYGKRINANLRAVQYVADGERIGRAPVNPVEEFEDISDDSDESNVDDSLF